MFLIPSVSSLVCVSGLQASQMIACQVLLVILLTASVSAHISDLITFCSGDDDERCRFQDEDYATFQSPEYKKRLFTLMSSGIPHIFWEEIGSNRSHQFNVSSNCISDLRHWHQKMRNADDEALIMMDSSGKFPTASMLKTTMAMGDFDHCLSMDVSQFCWIEIFPKQMNRSLWVEDKLSLDKNVRVQDTGLIQTMCLPSSSCSQDEFRSLMQAVVRPYLMTAEPGFLKCETKQLLTWTWTLGNMSYAQIAGLVYLVMMAALVTIGTLTHAVLTFSEVTGSSQLQLLTHISIVNSASRIFYVKEKYFDDHRRVLLDIFKAFGVCVTAISHAYSNIGSPLGYYLFDSQEKLVRFLKEPRSQAASNEAGVGVFMLLSGFAAFQVMYPMAKSKKLPYSLAFVDRLVKFVPAMAAIVAIEMAWPVFGSGPFYNHVSETNVKRCSQNGWANILLVNNWIASDDMCAPHTYFAALVIQLFLISLLVIKGFVRSDKTGVSMCLILITGSSVWTAVNAWRFNVTPTLFTPYPKGQDVLDHFSYIHAHISTNCSAFFAGFLCGFYILEKKVTLSLTRWSHVMAWIGLGIGLTFVSNGLMIASTCFALIPRSLSAVFVLVNRGSMVAHSAVLLFVLYSVSDEKLSRWLYGRKEQEAVEEPVVKDGEKFSFLVAFHRLALAIFFTNMSVANYDLFTRRRLVSLELSAVLSRSLFILLFNLIASFVFTVLYISPVEQFFRVLFSTRSEKQERKKE